MRTAQVSRGFHERSGTPQVVRTALAEHLREYGARPLAPLTVVIAALDEADNLPAVLAEIPDRIAGLAVDVLVVDDGSADATATVARAGGARVLRLAENCGHGVALRAGYRVVREGGGRYLATLDADGQWDPADLPAMVHLLVTDRADLVIGSRALGSTLDVDPLRTQGVRVFAALARLLTGAPVTDTSSGLRAMRADLTGQVRQTQPQYQTSELLVGAVLGGWRVAEVPTVMRPRLSGESKKGRNIVYALRYARVMVGTWWRESRRAEQVPRQQRPALGTRLVRYALGSLVCLAVSEIVLLLLLVSGVTAWIASIGASVAGIVPGYPLNRGWAFGRRGRSHFSREVVPYWVTTLLGTAVASVLTAVVDHWARHFTPVHSLRELLDLIAYVGAYGVMWMAKFVILDRLLFRSPAQIAGPAQVGPAQGHGGMVLPMSKARAHAPLAAVRETAETEAGGM